MIRTSNYLCILSLIVCACNSIDRNTSGLDSSSANLTNGPAHADEVVAYFEILGFTVEGKPEYKQNTAPGSLLDSLAKDWNRLYPRLQLLKTSYHQAGYEGKPKVLLTDKYQVFRIATNPGPVLFLNAKGTDPDYSGRSPADLTMRTIDIFQNWFTRDKDLMHRVWIRNHEGALLATRENFDLLMLAQTDLENFAERFQNECSRIYIGTENIYRPKDRTITLNPSSKEFPELLGHARNFDWETLKANLDKGH